jgi:hypothetical protein
VNSLASVTKKPVTDNCKFFFTQRRVYTISRENLSIEKNRSIQQFPVRENLLLPGTIVTRKDYGYKKMTQKTPEFA